MHNDLDMVSPRHSKTGALVEKKLFEGVSSFAELEGRIVSLDSELARGEAFEVFAEAYFATQPVLATSEVWPQATGPKRLIERLGLGTSRDMGVDGVFEVPLSPPCAYQVKFRSGRPSLTWQELSTFVGLTDMAPRRLLLTNCNDLPRVLETRERLSCVRGADLDKLTNHDFDAIRSFLRGAVISRQKKSPFLHQEEAVKDILSCFQVNDRATTVMACGSGKTLVALWIAERLKANRILVLVPSLALIAQTLREWMRESSWGKIAYMAVCSDPSVVADLDEICVNGIDLEFPVTTHSDELKSFLRCSFDGVKVVFSTYQSSRVVGEAIRGEHHFDFGVFDEAHKTAGKRGTSFSAALSEDIVPIRKRLFMTATPRHYDHRRRDKEGDALEVYSMDDQSIYGPRAHVLSFRKAVDREIICDYRVVVSVITSRALDAETFRFGKVVLQEGVESVREIAGKISLMKTVEQYDVKKAISFHGRVKDAGSFVGQGQVGLAAFLPGFECLHVNGSMRSSARENTMRVFRDASRSVISNARCLTEGVDAPAVDLVAFITPRRSKIDIVQAIGRAMRRPKGSTKRIGYVLLPLYVEQAKGETEEEAVARTGFDSIWEVIQALQEQDEVLADALRNAKTEKGFTGDYALGSLADHIEVLSPTVELDLVRRVVGVRIVEGLTSSWDEFFGRLKSYKERFGDCRVPTYWHEDLSLGQWVMNQRRHGRAGRLRDERKQKLEKLGMSLDTQTTDWDNRLQEAKVFLQEHGHLRVPRRDLRYAKLRTWLDSQQGKIRTRQLSEEKKAKLNQLGWHSSYRDSHWEEMLKGASDYVNHWGHLQVPKGEPETKQLWDWLRSQRAWWKSGDLPADRVPKVAWLLAAWRIAYVEDGEWTSDCRKVLSALYSSWQASKTATLRKNPKLHEWMEVQQKLNTQGTLSVEKKVVIDFLHTVVQPTRGGADDTNTRRDAVGDIGSDGLAEEWWSSVYEDLKEYSKRSSGAMDWVQLRKHSSALYQRAIKLRRLHAKGQLSADKLRLLEGLNMNLGAPQRDIDSRWSERYEELKAYKHQHGNCDVPITWLENQQLAAWVMRQRRFQRLGVLGNDRKVFLDKIGFSWSMKPGRREGIGDEKGVRHRQ